MKKLLLLLSICVLTTLFTQAQTNDSTSTLTQASARKFTRGDSLYLAKVNSSGNIMIAAGVGLCGAGGYLVYNGYRVYTSAPVGTTPGQQEESKNQNRKQGTIYLAVGGIAIAGGLVLTAIGAKNKVEFKRMKKRMGQQEKVEFQGGILDNGNLGVALRF